MLVFGIAGAVFMALDFPVAPILLGYVLGPLVEENFRRALLLSRGDLLVFFERPISATFMWIIAARMRGAVAVASSVFPFPHIRFSSVAGFVRA